MNAKKVTVEKSVKETLIKAFPAAELVSDARNMLISGINSAVK